MRAARPRRRAEKPTPRAAHAEAGDSKLAAFAQEYGWRAYAIPVLAVITVFSVAPVNSPFQF